MTDTATDFQLDGYRVDLAVFHGPLDLLLHLIKKEELDIWDIPIAGITNQYLKYIELMQTLNLEVAGEFILMASTLIRIKTRLLLPRDEENPDEPDPREELIMALIEYRKYREAGDILKEKALLEERNYIPPSPLGKIDTCIDEYSDITMFDLLTAFKVVLEAQRDEAFHEVDSQDISVEDRMEYVLLFLQKKDVATFPDLFADIPGKIVAIVTFIALLELIRSRRITISQSVPFAELRVYPGTRFSSPRESIDLIDAGEPKPQVVG
ncbi:MAG: segregation/condensation protein A [candidate division Zixibacteria bacterium]|nr:segregation/condensation protein A [candidate division Zixibacteria bacterium]